MSGTILIVDDSLTVRMDLAGAFESAGLTSMCCETIAAARETLADAEKIGLVVLDVLLPDGDGVDLLKEIRTSPDRTRLPVLMLSSEAEVKDRIRGLKTGADEYVGKPYDTKYVIAKARELLRARRAEPSTSPTVLVVDDSPTFQQVLAGALEDAGYSALISASGEDALALLADRRPNAIIVDGVLPGMDGATLIRRIRLDAALRGIPCVLLTASDDSGAELRALEAGADAFVRKDGDVDIILARVAAAMRRHVPGQEMESLTSPRKILAVDDSLTYLHEVANALRGEGYDVVLARSGEEALDLLAVQQVDCILLDLMMPGIGGKEACRRIKAAPAVRDIPLILLTSLEDRATMLDGLGAGADDYIPKSSEFEVLKARVRAQIRRKQFEDETRRIREELLHRELEAAHERAARGMAETRAQLVEELERKVEERTRALTRANTAKDEFLAIVSHELRTPLTSIRAMVSILAAEKLGGLTGGMRELVDLASRNCDRLIRVVDDLLDAVKINAGDLTLRLELTKIAPILEQALETRRFGSRDANVRLSIADDIRDSEILGDPVRIQQVLDNLLSNAVKFSNADAPIDVIAARHGGAVRISVVDRGIGIPAGFQAAVFDAFSAADTSATRRRGGIGVGLSVAKMIVEAHHGTIRFLSAEGEGSTFYFDLPLHQALDEEQVAQLA